MPPQIRAVQPSPSLLTEEGRAALPPRPASGRPSAGLGIQYDPSGAVVTGGPRTWRFSGSAGTRLGEILLGQAAADDSEAELLHTLGLWEAADPELASAQRESFADPDTLSGALRFCGRWAPTTRRHPSGAAAVEAWRQLRPVVVGESALARALIRELALSWPATVPEARELLVVVDGRPEPHESRAQLPVTTRGTTVAVGPWTEPGVSPCPPCATARLARAARPAGMAVPAPPWRGRTSSCRPRWWSPSWCTRRRASAAAPGRAWWSSTPRAPGGRASSASPRLPAAPSARAAAEARRRRPSGDRRADRALTGR